MDQDRWNAAHAAFARKIKTYSRHARYDRGLDAEDVEQELLIVLLRCVESYDPNNGARFNTYAQQSFQNRIISMSREARAVKRTPPAGITSLDIEAVAAVAQERKSSPSAEAEALLRITYEETIKKESYARSVHRAEARKRSRLARTA